MAEARATPSMPAGEVRVRSASPDDAAELARLKLLWSGTSDPVGATAQEFTHDLREWMLRLDEAVVCAVAESPSGLVGMGWLVIFERAPNVDDRHRLSGDVQSVYVETGWRGRGIGRAVLRHLLDEADARGIPRVTVSANERAASLYRGLGFRTSPLLLERRPRDRAP